MTKRQKIILSFAGIPVVLIMMYISGIIFDSAEKSFPKKAKEVASVIGECMFDLETQTDEFLRTNPKIYSYEWSNEHHEGIAFMKNGDTLEVYRGGCDHFLFECSKDLYFSDEKEISEDVIIGLAKQMSEDIFPKEEARLIESLIKTKNYQFEEGEKSKYWYLNYEGHTSTEIAFVYWDDTKHYSLSVGYLMN